MLRVPTVSFSMPYAGEHFEFLRPADPESILDAMTDEEYDKDKLLPYWAEQWPASFALFNFMAAYSGVALPPSGLVCELGSGLGIVSSILVHRHVRCIATDIALDACRFSRHNILLHAQRAHVVCADWRHLCFPQIFDCVIASDIIYEQRWVEPVLCFLGNALVPGGVAYIADPCRQWWNTFKNAAHAAGFGVKVSWEEQVNEGRTRVEIVRLARTRG